jgi:succinyl-CoA synthetase alpha subunit
MAEGGDEKASRSTPPVFISYASQDAAVANAVVEALERQGVRCWIAPRDVVPGEFYAGAIVHAIDAAKVIVLVLSESAATSQHVLREVERASSKRHPVVAFRTDLAPMPAELEYSLNASRCERCRRRTRLAEAP